MRAVHRVLSAAGTLLLVVGLVAGVAHREVLDADRFASHVDAIRTDPDVARQLGVLLTDRLLASQPDLTAIRPLLESTATTVVASPTLGPAVRISVSPLFDALVDDRGDDPVLLRLADVAAVVISVATVAAPGVQTTLPADLDVRLSTVGEQGLVGGTIGWVHLVTLLAWLCPLLGLVLLAGTGATLGRGDRDIGRVRAGLEHVGHGALRAGATLAGLVVVTGWVVARADPDTLGGALERAIWHELSGAFWAAAIVVVVLGYLLAAAGRGLVLRGPVLGSALVLLGLALVLQPLQVVTALLWTLGAALVLLGAAILVPTALTTVRWRAVAAGAAALALVGVFVAGALPADGDLAPTRTTATGEVCNGHAELCGRRYDEVAFPATHNSMAAASEPRWFFAEQPDGIIDQLDHGIRVLLIDSWYASATNRPGVVANTDESRARGLAEARQSFGDAAVESALRVRNALDLQPRGPVEPYLCHGLCEVGSTKWLPVMRRVHTWMQAHPDEVVTLFVQDEVSPADTAELLDRAGLLPYAYTPVSGQAWPTLGQMVTSGKRLVVLMENHGGGATYPWLLDGFQWAQDTPFLFRRPADFSCAPNRGSPDAPLFLLNHWITDKTREVTNATRVNARAVLLARAQQCQRERGMLPNYVAVDFYDRGDLMDVVDTLNGLD